MTATIETVEGADLCRVQVRASGFPVDATVIVERDGKLTNDGAFYVRIGNGTKKLDAVEREKYVASR